MRNDKIFILIILLSICISPFSITRQEVITEAEQYTQKPYGWEVRERNILDIREYYVETSTGSNNEQIKRYPYRTGQDGIDDRMQFYTKDDTDVVIISDTNNDSQITTADITETNRRRWPYEVGGIFTGVTYAFGYWNTYDNFNDKLNAQGAYIDKSYIVGKREGDPSTPINGFDYAAYTGIDCSGLVSRALFFDSHKGSTEFPEFTVKIDTKAVKPGDILNRYDKHIILFTGWKTKPKLNSDGFYHATFYGIHATPEKYSTCKTVRNVVADEVEIKYKSQDNIYVKLSYNNNPQWICGEAGQKWIFRSIFPQFSNPMPAARSAINSPNISCKIEGSGDIIISKFQINEISGKYYKDLLSESTYDEKTDILSFSFSEELPYGDYKISIKALNSFLNHSYVAMFSWEFKISETKLEYALAPNTNGN